MTGSWNILDCEPQVLEQIVGHGHAVEQLRVAVESCYADPGRPFPATLIVGPEGSRSLLARVVARELGAKLTQIDGRIVAVLGDWYAHLSDIEAGDCLLVDEVDELPVRAQAVLFMSIKYKRLGYPASKDREPRGIPLPDFTPLATARDECKILMPLRRLFTLTVRLPPLGIRDAERIIEQRARALRWQTEPGVPKAVVAAAGCLPRDALNYLDACHRRSRAAGASRLRAADVAGWFGGEW